MSPEQAIHLAASCAELGVLHALVSVPGIDINPVDRYGGTPTEDAFREGHHAVQEFLIAHGGLRKDAPELLVKRAERDQRQQRRLIQAQQKRAQNQLRDSGREKLVKQMEGFLHCADGPLAELHLQVQILAMTLDPNGSSAPRALSRAPKPSLTELLELQVFQKVLSSFAKSVHCESLLDFFIQAKAVCDAPVESEVPTKIDSHDVGSDAGSDCSSGGSDSDMSEHKSVVSAVSRAKERKMQKKRMKPWDVVNDLFLKHMQPDSQQSINANPREIDRVRIWLRTHSDPGTGSSEFPHLHPTSSRDERPTQHISRDIEAESSQDQVSNPSVAVALQTRLGGGPRPDTDKYGDGFLPPVGELWVDGEEIDCVFAEFSAQVPASTDETPVIEAVPFKADATLQNEASVKGNIMLVSRGKVPFSEKAKRASVAGAIALLVVNTNDELYSMTAGDGSTADGYVSDIPVLMIKPNDFVKLKIHGAAKLQPAPKRAEQPPPQSAITARSASSPLFSDTTGGFSVREPPQAPGSAAIVSAFVGNNKSIVRPGSPPPNDQSSPIGPSGLFKAVARVAGKVNPALQEAGLKSKSAAEILTTLRDWAGERLEADVLPLFFKSKGFKEMLIERTGRFWRILRLCEMVTAHVGQVQQELLIPLTTTAAQESMLLIYDQPARAHEMSKSILALTGPLSESCASIRAKSISTAHAAKRLFKRLELRDALVHFGEDEASDEDGGSANEATVVNSKPSISVMG